MLPESLGGSPCLCSNTQSGRCTFTFSKKSACCRRGLLRLPILTFWASWTRAPAADTGVTGLFRTPTRVAESKHTKVASTSRNWASRNETSVLAVFASTTHFTPVENYLRLLASARFHGDTAVALVSTTRSFAQCRRHSSLATTSRLNVVFRLIPWPDVTRFRMCQLFPQTVPGKSVSPTIAVLDNPSSTSFRQCRSTHA